MQVALGHAHVIGAVQAVARAGRRLGNDRDGGHAACCATRLHAKRGEELALELVVDVERLPGNRILLLEPKVVREHAFLGIGTLPLRRTLVMAVEDLTELDGIERAVDAHCVEYVHEYFVHDARFYRERKPADSTSSRGLRERAVKTAKRAVGERPSRQGVLLAGSPRRNAVQCSPWISKPHACSMPSQAIFTRDALPPSRRREHGPGMAGSDAWPRLATKRCRTLNSVCSTLAVEHSASRTFLLNTRMRI